MQDETLTETLSLIDEETPLPEGWRWAKLQELCTDVSDGTHFTPEYISKGVPFLSVKDVKENGIFFNSCRYISQAQHEQLCRRCKPERGDVLYTKVGTTGIAKAIDIDTEFSIFVSVALLKLNDKVLPSYLERALNSPIGREQAENLTQGAANRNLVLRDIRTIKIPLPPTIEEQRRIASVLDGQMKAVEQARLAVEAQLKAANLLPNAFLRVVFESEEAQNWQKRKLGDYAKVQSGYAFKTDWYVKDGIRLLRNANVFQGFIDWSDAVKLDNKSRPKFSSYELNEGDIVLSLDRPLVSNGLKVAKLQADDVPSLLLQRVGRFLLNDEIDSNYLYTFLNSENFINEIKGHDQSLGVPHISPSQVENIEIPIPPTIEEQRKLTKRINEQMQAAETLKKSLTEKLEAVKKLPAALLRKAFAGEI